jgi:hypothetical protein
MSTKKTFVATAAAIKRTREETLTNAMLADPTGATEKVQDNIMRNMAARIAYTFAQLNPAFDFGRFMRACGYDD